ncbi:SRPBCC family protein [Pseudonocardia alni]|uniref:SRPBCC family protein n=1 Tax=Pseudonocardia alni TaxID=33907 RepID=UPI00279D5E6C|nr:SRPBCC family protein [Pseudonocardia alni]
MAEERDGSTSVLDQLPTDRLKQAGQLLLKAAADRAVGAAMNQVEGLTERLTGVAENGGTGLGAALGGGGSEEGGNPVTNAVKGGFSAVKDKVMGAVGLGGDDDSEDSEGGSGGGGSGGGRGKFKFMNIVEHLDVGVPVRVAYDQWTQFADFSTFMKKVQSVDQESDEKTNWKAQVFWSKRTWSATIIEQIPDTHIIWRSQGAKGYANGCVSFHELAPNLTRVVLILEYYPVGLFEKTGNIWRAVGRRARLEFKHYGRHVMVETLLNREELEGWRGEIRDSEVVKTHEEGLEEEREAEYDDEDAEYDDDEDAEYDDDYEDAEYDDDLAEDDDLADEEPVEDDDYAEEDLDEDDLADDGAVDEEPADEPDPGYDDAEYDDPEYDDPEYDDAEPEEAEAEEPEPEEDGGRRAGSRRRRTAGSRA